MNDPLKIMVKLVGVHHGVEKTFFDFLQGIKTSHFGLNPSVDLIKYLSELPKGTKVGLEAFSDQDWKDIKEDLNKLNFKNLDLLIREDGQNYCPYYPDLVDSYWNILIPFLFLKKHDIRNVKKSWTMEQ